ncbi:predicted protein [Nematostella vectensis]|uniref:Uncharacterized protein n=1 Tax=Nematostella vectensis TaxID=45351 RepID=A7S6D5_NEMVE|nr:uncharacterized protein LOC5512429 [Nematostella vectensis]EDO40700.1 predicted protein [Nematostella vectensis]|eukprot:XP_001632763.1 predicted protein [Nematostella vectensis]
MAYQFSSTTRLRHIDYPENQSSNVQWEQVNTTSTPGIKSPPFGCEGSEEGKDKISIAQQIEKGNRGSRKEKPVLPAFRSNDSLNNTKNITTQAVYSASYNQSRGFNSGPAGVSIELDVLESFSEFAAYLELQNPICPAELLDTPEKLMNILAWDVCV